MFGIKIAPIEMDPRLVRSREEKHLARLPARVSASIRTRRKLGSNRLQRQSRLISERHGIASTLRRSLELELELDGLDSASAERQTNTHTFQSARSNVRPRWNQPAAWILHGSIQIVGEEDNN